MNEQKKHESLLENVAAISANFHGDKKYADFYNTHGEAMGGFPAIWRHMVDAGQAFTAVEALCVAEWVDGWIEAVDLFAECLLGSRHQTERDLWAAAEIAIMTHVAVEGLTEEGRVRHARFKELEAKFGSYKITGPT